MFLFLGLHRDFCSLILPSKLLRLSDQIIDHLFLQRLKTVVFLCVCHVLLSDNVLKILIKYIQSWGFNMTKKHDKLIPLQEKVFPVHAYPVALSCSTKQHENTHFSG